MITLTQLGLSGGGGGSSLGDTIYRHGEGPLITRDDGSVFIRSGTLLPFSSEYQESRAKLPNLFQKNTTALSIVHTGDVSVAPSRYVYHTNFFYANNRYYAVSQGTTGKMSVSANMIGGYSTISTSATQVVDTVKVGNTIVVSGANLDGSTPSIKLGYINTTNNTFVTASALGGNVPTGLLASNGTAAVFRGVSNAGGVLYTHDANSYYTTNGTTWTVSTGNANTFNPVVWFWSPAAGKYILASRSETTVWNDLAVPQTNLLDENGNTIPFNYLSIFYSALGYDDWWLYSLKPGTGGAPGSVSHLANTLYRYENDISTSDAIRYPAAASYITSTPWQSLYANSPTVSLFSPGLYQAIARTTTGEDVQIIDLSEHLNDPVKTTQRILLAWDGSNFLAFYGSIVLYSPDGLTWTRSPHLLWNVVSTAYGTMYATAPSAVTVANNRIATSFYGFSAPYIPFTYNTECTTMYLANTTPTTMGPTTVNYVWGGTNSGTTFAYSYTRIK